MLFTPNYIIKTVKRQKKTKERGCANEIGTPPRYWCLITYVQLSYHILLAIDDVETLGQTLERVANPYTIDAVNSTVVEAYTSAGIDIIDTCSLLVSIEAELRSIEEYLAYQWNIVYIETEVYTTCRCECNSNLISVISSLEERQHVYSVSISILVERLATRQSILRPLALA